ncbi:MAG: UGMP family protein [Nanoarchaeota archaeon]|nr:UGMP family protein [Nanoarchaeota archaeon]MBU1028439.1 UGMP family protein [Nanoarchaeota archaeon]
MPTILGIESTAHTFGIGIVKDGKILANVRDMYTTESGGIIPIESAKHHAKIADEVYDKAISEAGINEKEVDAIAFSNAPGLAPCLIEGMKFAKKLANKLKKPLVSVNHCIAHLEIGRITGAKDPVMLYVSGANTQIIAYETGKYRIFGETLDLGVGNFIDTVARFMGLGFPGGYAIEKLAKFGKYVELPYSVKGMDIVLSGIQTNIKQKIEKLKLHPQVRDINKIKLMKKRKVVQSSGLSVNSSQKSEQSEVNYSLADLAFSLQETVFAMLVETAERALAHTGKKELLLAGGVACNSRLVEMCKIMCAERGCKFFVPEKSLLIDNGSMIAFTGEILFKNGIKKKPEKVDIFPRERIDNVEISWK